MDLHAQVLLRLWVRSKRAWRNLCCKIARTVMDWAPESPSKERYFRILDTAPDAMVVVGRDQKMTFVNVQTEKLFGYPPSSSAERWTF
jgi:PAS domain-containing protein